MTCVAVIGGGLVGASAAYHLARLGVEVTLVDRADPGQGTAAGAGIVCPALSLSEPDSWYRLAFAAIGYYPELLDALADDGEDDTGYGAVGALFVATNQAEDAMLTEVQRLLEERRRAGVMNIGDVRRLTEDGLLRLFPFLREGLSGLHLTDAARVDGRRLRDSLLRAMQRYGVEIYRGEAELTRKGDRVTGVRVDDQEILADAAIVAAGAWSAELCRPLGVEIPVYPQRGQIVHLDVRDADTAEIPIVVGFHSHYMLAFPRSRVVVGATREEKSGFDHRVTAAGLHEVLDQALFIAPGLADATVSEIRVGFRPASPDGLPFLGLVETVPGLVVATGLGPTGLTVGPYAGVLAADLVLGRKATLDLRPYDPLRSIPVAT